MEKLTAQTKATMKYHQKKIKRMVFDFNIENDRDILEKLEQVPAKATYIKQLIRDDIKNKKN